MGRPIKNGSKAKAVLLHLPEAVLEVIAELQDEDENRSEFVLSALRHYSPEIEKACTPAKVVRILRASGGHLFHYVDDEGVAVCGYKPGSKSPQMRGRGRWLSCDRLAKLGASCPKCDAQHDSVKVVPASRTRKSASVDK